MEDEVFVKYLEILDIALSMGNVDLLVALWKEASGLKAVETGQTRKDFVRNKIEEYTPTLLKMYGYPEENMDFKSFVEACDIQDILETLSCNAKALIPYVKENPKRAHLINKVLQDYMYETNRACFWEIKFEDNHQKAEFLYYMLLEPPKESSTKQHESVVCPSDVTNTVRTEQDSAPPVPISSFVDQDDVDWAAEDLTIWNDEGWTDGWNAVSVSDKKVMRSLGSHYRAPCCLKLIFDECKRRKADKILNILLAIGAGEKFLYLNPFLETFKYFSGIICDQFWNFSSQLNKHSVLDKILDIVLDEKATTNGIIENIAHCDYMGTETTPTDFLMLTIFKVITTKSCKLKQKFAQSFCSSSPEVMRLISFLPKDRDFIHFCIYELLHKKPHLAKAIIDAHGFDETFDPYILQRHKDQKALQKLLQK